MRRTIRTVTAKVGQQGAMAKGTLSPFSAFCALAHDRPLYLTIAGSGTLLPIMGTAAPLVFDLSLLSMAASPGLGGPPYAGATVRECRVGIRALADDMGGMNIWPAYQGPFSILFLKWATKPPSSSILSRNAGGGLNLADSPVRALRNIPASRSISAVSPFSNIRPASGHITTGSPTFIELR